MFNEIQVNNLDYSVFKEDVLSNRVISRTKVNSSEVKIEDLKTIIIEGVAVNLSKSALASLFNILSISQEFVKTVSNAFEDNKTKILNQLITTLRNGKEKGLILVYNNVLNTVVDIYQVGDKLIHDSQYFEILERMVDKTESAYLRNISRDPEGNISAVIKVPALEFQFGNLSEEVFESGFTLDASKGGVSSSFFTERLWCANGCVTKTKYSTKSLKSPDRVGTFVADLISPTFQVENIEEFKRQIMTTKATQASLKEVLAARNGVARITGNYADRFLPTMSADRIEATFNSYSPDYLLNRNIQEHLYTDITVWELVNEITAVSSSIEQNALAIGERTNLDLQILGGTFLFKKPDLIPTNIRQVFAPKILSMSNVRPSIEI